MIAIFIDPKLKRSESEIKYTFSFVFKTLGYELKFVSNLKQVLQNDILIYYTPLDLSMKEAYLLAKKKLLLYIPAFQELLQPGKLLRSEIDDYTQEIELHKKIPVIAADVIKYPIQYFRQDEIFYVKFNFDLIGNVFFNLIQYCEVSNRNPQASLKDEEISFFRYHLSPYINNLLWILEKCLQDTIHKEKNYFLLKKEFWPESEDFAVSFSHSINSLRKWNWKKILRSTFQDILQFYRFKFVFKNAWSKLKYILTNIEEYWNFDLINELESLNDVNSTYFLGINVKSAENFNYKYNDRDLKNEIQTNLNQGNEISLLASKDAHVNDVLSHQKENLFLLTGQEKIGVRHYRGRFDTQRTTEFHKKNGFDYDSSQTFLHRIGFKHGIAFPYHFHTIQKSGKRSKFQYQTRYFELPISFSDHALRINDGTYIPLEQVKKYYHEIRDSVNFTNGYLNFDFAVANFTEIPYLKELYRYILEDMKPRKVYSVTCLEIAEWWRKRESVEISESEQGILIYFPDRFKHFTFRLVGEYTIDAINGAEAEIEENLIRFTNIKPDTKVQINLRRKTLDEEECETF